jgi:hypothetical protein
MTERACFAIPIDWKNVGIASPANHMIKNHVPCRIKKSG